MEIAKKAMNLAYGAGGVPDKTTMADAVLEVLKAPACTADDGTKMSSYEPNLLTMMDLTPKVIGCVKDISPDTMLIGFKLLENVPKTELFQVASRLRQKNRADYIVANDLSRIGKGKHPAMFVGEDTIMCRDAVVAECETKQDIADTICRLAFPDTEAKLVLDPSAKRTVWQVIAANNMNTDIRVEGFSYEKKNAWHLMREKFIETMREMLPDITDDLAGVTPEDGWEFDDDRRRASISSDGASVYDGDDMWYYNLVPVAEVPVAPPVPWKVVSPDGSICEHGAIDNAWIAMWIAFKKALHEATGWYDCIPDSRDIMDAMTWGIVRDNIRASVGPMCAELYDGTKRLSWRLSQD